MKLPSNVKFANQQLKEKFYELEKNNQELFKFLNQALNNIEENAFCGIQIPKKLIPKTYSKKYKIKNLWKYDLPKGWRLFYSVTSNKIIVISLILEWFNHKKYEKKMKY
jgi:Txe/YoeB family toxin of Txe-Axe toxin-antitoxin module